MIKFKFNESLLQIIATVVSDKTVFLSWKTVNGRKSWD